MKRLSFLLKETNMLKIIGNALLMLVTLFLFWVSLVIFFSAF